MTNRNDVDQSTAEFDLAALIAEGQARPKPWYLSRTLIGLMVMLASQAAKASGVEIQTEALTDAIVTGLDLLGAALVWWGRVAATRPISRRILPGVVLGGPVDGVRTAGANGQSGPDGVHADRGGSDPGYWSGRLGPFDSES